MLLEVAGTVGCAVGRGDGDLLLAFELVTFLLQSGRLPRESRVVLGAFD